jgi:hypothetical protein
LLPRFIGIKIKWPGRRVLSSTKIELSNVSRGSKQEMLTLDRLEFSIRLKNLFWRSSNGNETATKSLGWTKEIGKIY